MELFYPIKPAPLIAFPEDKSKWVVEPKLQGWHTLWVKQANSVRIFSRTLKEISHWKGLKDSFEIFTDAADGFYLAELLGPEERTHDVRSIQRGIKANPMFFDYVTNKISKKSLLERKKDLKNYIPECYVVPYFEIKKRNKLNELKFKLEGEVWKKKDSIYEASNEGTLLTPDWLKIRY